MNLKVFCLKITLLCCQLPCGEPTNVSESCKGQYTQEHLMSMKEHVLDFDDDLEDVMQVHLWQSKANLRSGSDMAPSGRSEQLESAEEAISLLNATYGGMINDPFYLPVDKKHVEQEVVAADGYPLASIYGEILPHTVVDLLREVKAKPGQKFYDLGSGNGKAVLLAYLMGLDATGVEVAHDRWDHACHALKQLKREHHSKYGIRFLRKSFLDVDFSDADIIFTNSILFDSKMLNSLALTAQNMKPGAKIISSEGLDGDQLLFLGYFKGLASWSNSTQEWVMQEVSGDTPKLYSDREDNHHLYGSEETESQDVCTFA